MKIELSELKQIVFDKLNKELPKHLYYHSVAHVADVYQAALHIAEREGITPEEKELLATAVLFHDSGFIYQSKNHEEKGVEIVKETLPGYGYSADEIEKICGMIMATQIPQTPHNKLEEIICDADLDYLGRDDFWEIGNSLYREILAAGTEMSERDWNQLQLKFLSAHHYFTVTAIRERKAKKQQHVHTITTLI
jgi:predicted metal-dependent HD superfamily phosphohydrolase